MIIFYRLHTKNQKNILLPKPLQSAWRYYCFPCVQNPAPVAKIPSHQNQRNRSRLASRSNCTHLKEISPPHYHIHINNTFRACGKNSPDKKNTGKTSEMNITGTLPSLLLMAKSWSQILRDSSPRHACLGEVSRESASRQSRELIMRSERTTNVQRGGRRESQGRVNLPFV